MLTEEDWAAIQSLPREAQRADAIDFLMKYVPLTPKLRRADGKLKELKGEYRGYWQFDIDRQYRIIYTIDEDSKEILIEYIGFHPDWGRKTSRGGRIKR
jgi:addiction module RelE/StbE family toxin